MKIALLIGTDKRQPQVSKTLGIVQYDHATQNISFLAAAGFQKWSCKLNQNTLGLQDCNPPEGLGFRITSLSEGVMVTFTDKNSEQNFLLDQRSIDRYTELFQ